MAKEKPHQTEKENNECFIIMPIAEVDGYENGHFQKVYQDIFKVACEKAGYMPVRADEVKQTNLIHLDILQKLIDSPMAICDLSNRNPNVLFELGLRQAFDKPTVLVQERGTPQIFDISLLRYSEYRKELKYREVLEDQDSIAIALRSTKEATDKGEGVNSIVNLLSLSNPASLKDVTENDSARMLQIVMGEMNELRTDLRSMRNFNEKFYGTYQRGFNSEVINKSENENDFKRAELSYNELNKEFIKLRSLIKNNFSSQDIKTHFESMNERFIIATLNTSSPVMKEKLRRLLREIEFYYAEYNAKPNTGNTADLVQ